MKRMTAAAALGCTLIVACAADGTLDQRGGDENVASNAAALDAQHDSAEVSAEAFEDIFREVANKQIIKGDIKWNNQESHQVDVSRVDDNTINVVFKLKADRAVDIPIYARLNIGFSCYWKNPGIYAQIESYHVNADPPLWLRLVSADYVNIVADRIANNQMDDVMETEVHDIVAFHFGRFCPRISIANDGALELVEKPGNECTNDKTRVRACTAPEFGQGMDDVCVNGYWELSDDECGNCEPGSPARTVNCPPNYTGKATYKCIHRNWEYDDSACRWDSTPSGPSGGGEGNSGEKNQP